VKSRRDAFRTCEKSNWIGPQHDSNGRDHRRHVLRTAPCRRNAILWANLRAILGAKPGGNPGANPGANPGQEDGIRR
jgi:hypothetical protein